MSEQENLERSVAEIASQFDEGRLHVEFSAADNYRAAMALVEVQKRYWITLYRWCPAGLPARWRAFFGVRKQEITA